MRIVDNMWTSARAAIESISLLCSNEKLQSGRMFAVSSFVTEKDISIKFSMTFEDFQERKALRWECLHSTYKVEHYSNEYQAMMTINMTEWCKEGGCMKCIHRCISSALNVMSSKYPPLVFINFQWSKLDRCWINMNMGENKHFHTVNVDASFVFHMCILRLFSRLSRRISVSWKMGFLIIS